MDQTESSENPWWHPVSGDLYLEEPLPPVVILLPDYGAGFDAGLPLWSEESGQITWHSTKFSPELLERLANWQEQFDSDFHWEKGWRSERAQNEWAEEATNLAADVRTQSGTRADLAVHLWPLKREHLVSDQSSVSTEQADTEDARRTETPAHRLPGPELGGRHL